jgi:small-conductance mechanosensitive channel
MGLLATIMVSCTTAIILGESGNSTIESFALMFVCGSLAGWKLDQMTRGKWQLYRAVRNWHPPFYLELGLILLAAVWFFFDAAVLMRSVQFEVTVEHVTVWLLLTVGMGASLSRALADRKREMAVEKLKTSR